MVARLSLNQKIWAARLALALECVWPRLIPATGSVSLLFAYGLYEGPAHFPAAVHNTLLVLWLLVTGVLLWRAVKVLRWPSFDQACRRLERDSNVSHQPLQALTDQPALQGSSLLWRAHQKRMERLYTRMRPSLPRFEHLLTQDVWGVRFWVFVPLAFGLVVGSEDSGARLYRAVSPVVGLADGLKVWVAPPAATGLAAWELKKTQAGPVRIPAGSVIRAVIGSGLSRASIKVDGDGTDFEGEGDQHVEVKIEQANDLSIKRAFVTLAAWPIETVPDLPPSIAFTKPPEPEKKRPLVRVGVEAHDDYGLVKVWLRLTPQVGGVVEKELPLSTDKPRSLTLEMLVGGDDGTLSGQTISVQPMAKDSAGQETGGEPQQLVWPQRPYGDAQAKALSQWRKSVMDNPASAAEIASKLEELNGKIDDMAAMLDLGIAKRDLLQDQPDVADAQGLMLGAANRLEERNQERVSRMLGELGQALDDAMKRGDKDATKRLAERYADLLQKMMGSPNQDGAEMSLSQDEMQDILNRLDQVAGDRKADAKLRQKMQDLAKTLTDKSEPGGNKGQDPFGNKLGGRANGDDASTKIPGPGESNGIGPILDDIRNRLMDGARPKPEREYLKRLLDLPTQ